MVIPMAWFNDDGPGLAGMATIAVEEFETNVLGVLVDCLSEDAEVVGISAECMDNGGIPYRKNYVLGTHPGTRAAGVVPQQVAALVVYYPDPSDVSPGTATNTGGNFVPGIAEGDVNAEIVAGALKTVLELFAAELVTGFVAGPGTITRAIFAARNGARLLRQAVNYVVRDYVGTIRRRLLPH